MGALRCSRRRATFRSHRSQGEDISFFNSYRDSNKPIGVVLTRGCILKRRMRFIKNRISCAKHWGNLRDVVPDAFTAQRTGDDTWRAILNNPWHKRAVLALVLVSTMLTSLVQLGPGEVAQDATPVRGAQAWHVLVN